MEASELTRKALESGYRTIVAVGGDGTLNEVVNGFFRADGTPVAPGAAISLLPRGTGGDFRKTAGIPHDWAGAARHVAKSKVRTIDVGRVTFRAHDGSRASRYFLNIASCGLSGAVDAEINKSSKALGGKLSFMLASAKGLWKYRDHDVKISVEGGESWSAPITTLAFGNGQFFGGGMRVTPQATLDDGIMHVTQWSGYGLADFIFKSKGVYSGSHVEWPGTKCFTAKRATVEGPAECLLDIDGEQPGTLPATFELIPGAIGLRA